MHLFKTQLALAKTSFLGKITFLMKSRTFKEYLGSFPCQKKKFGKTFMIFKN
jgi:hypothetical protein